MQCMILLLLVWIVFPEIYHGEGRVEYEEQVFSNLIQWPRFKSLPNGFLSLLCQLAMQKAVEKNVKHDYENDLQDVEDVPDVDKANIGSGWQSCVHVVNQSAQYQQGSYRTHEPIPKVIDVNVDG